MARKNRRKAKSRFKPQNLFLLKKKKKISFPKTKLRTEEDILLAQLAKKKQQQKKREKLLKILGK